MSCLPSIAAPRQSLRLPPLVGLKRARDAFPLELPTPTPASTPFLAVDKENASNKCSLAFILSSEQSAAPRLPSLPSLPSLASLALGRAASPAPTAPTAPTAWGTPQKAPCARQAPALQPAVKAARRQAATAAASPASAPSTAVPVKKGSKYCMVEGCTSRAKHARRCWRHGGSVQCKVAGCSNRAKTKGVCWSHGGGTACSFAGCSTISVSNGVCWAHGGGKRCAMEGCARPAYERTDHLCTLHFEEKQYIARLGGAGRV